MKKPNFKSIYVTKCLFLMFSLFLLCFACNQQSYDGAFNRDIQGVDPIEGVWGLTNHYWVKDGDTLYLGPDEIGVKHKIYLDGFVMWTADPLADSSEWHGYGTYHFKDDTLIENLLSMSLPVKAEIGSEEEVIFKFEYDKNFLKHATKSVHRETIYQSIEEWKKLN